MVRALPSASLTMIFCRRSPTPGQEGFPAARDDSSRTAAIRAFVHPRPGIPVSVFGYGEDSRTADSKQFCLFLFHLSIMCDEHDPRIVRV